MKKSLVASFLIASFILSMQSNALARGGRSAWDCDEMTEDCEDDIEKAPITVLDEKTGLMVIERESDSEWNQSPEPKLPFSQIIKLSSSFDGQSEYAVFDKKYLFCAPKCAPNGRKWPVAFQHNWTEQQPS